MNIFELDRQYIMGTYRRQNICIKQGSGAVCTDESGKEYIDLGSGIGVNSLGYCDKEWADAVSKQAHTLQHTSNLYYSAPDAELAQMLCEKTGYQKVLFQNSGAEANECAIKIARKYSADCYGEQASRNRILTLVNSFHGRTVTTLAATGQDVFHTHFYPFTEGFSYAPANDFDAVKAVLAEGGFCAVMFEPVQGEGGVMELDADFLKEVADYCTAHDLLLIADEVQTGMGRTGTLLACEQLGVKPDVVTLAKGLGGGLPIGAVLANEKTCNVLSYGDHGTTFGGNPVVCAGAKVVVSRVSDPSFLLEVQKKGVFLKRKLLACEEVAGVSGLGMMLGISLKTKEAAKVCAQCIEAGVIVLTAKNKVRLLPPLSISWEELTEGVDRLISVLNA